MSGKVAGDFWKGSVWDIDENSGVQINKQIERAYSAYHLSVHGVPPDEGCWEQELLNALRGLKSANRVFSASLTKNFKFWERRDEKLGQDEKLAKVHELICGGTKRKRDPLRTPDLIQPLAPDEDNKPPRSGKTTRPRADTPRSYVDYPVPGRYRKDYGIEVSHRFTHGDFGKWDLSRWFEVLQKGFNWDSTRVEMEQVNVGMLTL